MIMVNAASDVSLVAVAVFDDAAVEEDIVDDEVDGVVIQIIRGVEGFYGCLTIGHYLSCEVQVAEQSMKCHFAVSITLQVAQERLRERVAEFQTGALGADVEVDIVANRRYVAVDIGVGVVLVVGHSVDVDLFVCLIPKGAGYECTHASLLKTELLNL